jgi:hypothetical protein
MSDIYLQITETPTVVTLSQPVIGSSVAATVTVANTVTVALDANSLSALENVTVTVGAAVTISNFPSSQAVTFSNLAITDTQLRASAVTIGGTVTIGALPSGALTTRFGSVTTANTAQITSAVTNTSRKYLLAQNISSSAVTIGIGFSPTTTQGIQLNAGAGLTFDAFCPTGAVYWLGPVTGASFTILEG